MKIFNMSNREKGELSIFTGDEWLKLDGKHAEYIYQMNEKIDKLNDVAETLSAEKMVLLATLSEIANNKSNGQTYTDANGDSISGYELDGADCQEIAQNALKSLENSKAQWGIYTEAQCQPYQK